MCGKLGLMEINVLHLSWPIVTQAAQISSANFSGKCMNVRSDKSKQLITGVTVTNPKNGKHRLLLVEEQRKKSVRVIRPIIGEGNYWV